MLEFILIQANIVLNLHNIKNHKVESLKKRVNYEKKYL